MSTTTLEVPIEHKILFSRHEAAVLLSVSVPTLDKLVALGKIHFVRVGGPIRGRVLFSKIELQRFAEKKLPIKG